MADLDPRIAQFNKAAAEALAATRRAGQEVNRLTAKTKTAADQQSRLSTRAKGATNVVSEEATPRVVRASEQRTAAYQAEQAALARLNKTRAEGITKLDAEALTRQAAFRNVQQYGPYAGGRRNFDQFGYGGGSGPPSIPPGGRVPPPGGFPALPPAGGTGNVPKPSVITAGIEQESKRYVEAQANAQRYTQSVSRLAQEQNLASQAMRKNGALTTEFISAAQRGEVTIRELGYQTTATIGKFGGWLAAGSAVYGAFAAVSKLGAGALDAYSGVNQLERVIRTGINADQLKGEFSDLAGEFNLPVETVTEAVYQMGKVFHTQSGAIAAANSVLYSTKVGELDVADATRYLIAIVNGFHLPASKMAEVFDQINAAQNEFGITISDVEAGLAKASGTFNAAGGSYSNLLALITTAQKATGNTGDVVGTALARAPNFLRKPENEQILKEFGIQPSQAIDKIIEDAFEISGELSGKKLQVLAAAIFGPQYGARIGTPLLQQGNLFEEVKRKTSPEAAKGSAARELDKQLGSVNEQISRVGVSFERLGAQLADSHALDAAGGLLQLLNLTLDAAISLTEAFNALPDGLQQALVYGGQLALLLRGLRRLNLGETIAGPTGQATGVRGAAAEFFGRGPIGEARLYRQALIAEKQDLEQKVATATTQGTQAAGVQQAARARLERENARAAALAPAALGPGASEKSVAAYDDSVRKVQALNSELATTEEVQQRMAAQADFYNKELGRVDQSMRNVTGRFGTLDTRGALTDRERRTGVQYYGGTFERPSSTRPLTGPGAQLPLFGGVDALAKEEAATVKGAEDTMQRAEAQVNRNQAAVGRLSQAGGRLSSAFNGIINRLGTVFFVAGVGLALYQVYDSIKSSLQSDLDALEKAATSRADIKSIAKEAPKDYSSVSRGIAEVLRGESFLPGIGEDPESYVKRLFSGGGETETEILEAADKARIQSAKNILKLQAKQRNKGLPQQFRYSDELRKEVQKIASSNKSRAQKLEEFARVETENEQDFDTLYHGRNNTKGQKAVEQAIEIAKAVNGTVKDYRDILQKLDGKELDEIAANYAGVITGATGKFNPRAAQKAALAYEEQVRRLSGNSSPKAQKELLDAQQQYYEALSGGITSELTLSLQRARSPQQRAEAAAKALHQVAAQYKTGPARRFRQQREAVEKAEDELAGAQDLERDRTNGGPSFNLPAGGGRKAIDRAKTSLKAQREKLKRLGKAAREQSEAGEILEEELRQQIFESVSAVRDAKFQYKISLTADPLKQAALELRQVNADLPGAIRAYGKDSAEVYALLQQKQQALANQVQQELALISARADLSAAGIDPSDTLAQDRAAVSKVEAELAFMRSHANRFDPAQIIQQEASLRKAQIQLAEDIEQEAIDLQNAAFQRKINQAEVNDHPVRAAQLAINQTKYQIRNAKTPVEKANLEADLVSQYGAKRDAVAQAALDNIEFKASIEKITTTQEIAALERLLHDYKLSRDMRRQIRQQIFNLKNGEGSEGGFELDVGSITLPTVYDIRRAIQGGVQAQAGVNVTNAPTVTVNNFSSDPAVVGRALSRVLGGSTASALRSAGVGG